MRFPRAPIAMLAAWTVGLLAAPAHSQPAWPSRPVRIVVPYSAGGTADILARVLSQKFNTYFGTAFTVENMGGAGGNLGAATVARAAADGETLMVTAPGPLTSNDKLFASMHYNVETAFAAVSLLAEVPIILVAHPGAPFNDTRELLEKARAQPGGITFGSQGVGTTSHLTMELLKAKAGLNMVHVPYRGSAPAITDLMGGQIKLMFDNSPTVLPQVVAGTLKPVAVAGRQRIEGLPQVPTLIEGGLDVESSAWFGLVAPAGTPEPVIGQIAAAASRALAEPDVKEQLGRVGVRLIGSGSSEFGQFLRVERRKWTEVIDAAGVRPQ